MLRFREWERRCACPWAILPPAVMLFSRTCAETAETADGRAWMYDDLFEAIEELLDAVERVLEGEEGDPGTLFALLWRALYDLSCRRVRAEWGS